MYHQQTYHVCTAKTAKAETDEADYNSRHPEPLTTEDNGAAHHTEFANQEDEEWFEKDIRAVVQAALPDAVSWVELLEETSQDPELKDLKSAMSKGYFTAPEPQALGPQFDSVVTELAVVGGLLVRGSRYPGHFATKLRMSPLPSEPWREGAIDFWRPINTGEYLLVGICKHLRWVEVEFVITTSGRAVLPRLDRIFSSLGIPLIVGNENGPPFNGQDFMNFSKYLGFKHERKTPKNLQANAEVGRRM